MNLLAANRLVDLKNLHFGGGFYTIIYIVKYSVKVKAGTSRNFVSEDGEQLTVYTHARAHDGEANEAVIRLIAEHFGVAKTRVKIIRGATSKNKIIDVE